MLFLMLGLFVLGISSFNTADVTGDSDCIGYANNAMASENEQFGELPPMQQFQGWLWYYNTCCDLGENSTLSTATVISD
jgi:hypothetical protein